MLSYILGFPKCRRLTLAGNDDNITASSISPRALQCIMCLTQWAGACMKTLKLTLHAECIATADEEHAVSYVSDGPFHPK